MTNAMRLEGASKPQRQRVLRLDVRERQRLNRMHARRKRKKRHPHRLARSRSQWPVTNKVSGHEKRREERNSGHTQHARGSPAVRSLVLRLALLHQHHAHSPASSAYAPTRSLQTAESTHSD
jgi:hypothetical protein